MKSSSQCGGDRYPHGNVSVIVSERHVKHSTLYLVRPIECECHWVCLQEPDDIFLGDLHLFDAIDVGASGGPYSGSGWLSVTSCRGRVISLIQKGQSKRTWSRSSIFSGFCPCIPHRQ